VLPVVHAVSGVRIGKRRRSTSGRRPGFDYQHAETSFGQLRRCAEASQSGAKNNRVVPGRHAPTNVRAQMLAAISAR